LRSSFDALKVEDQLLVMDVALFYPEKHRVHPGVGWNIFKWLCMIYGINQNDLKLRVRVV